jgi:hypothetical protein
MREKVTYFSSYSVKLSTVVRRHLSVAIVLSKEDVQVHLDAPETKTEHF